MFGNQCSTRFLPTIAPAVAREADYFGGSPPQNRYRMTNIIQRPSNIFVGKNDYAGCCENEWWNWGDLLDAFGGDSAAADAAFPQYSWNGSGAIVRTRCPTGYTGTDRECRVLTLGDLRDGTSNVGMVSSGIACEPFPVTPVGTMKVIYLRMGLGRHSAWELSAVARPDRRRRPRTAIWLLTSGRY